MAISEFEIKRCKSKLEALLERIRPPVQIRKEVDYGYKHSNQSFKLEELRPNWQNNSEIIHIPICKLTYVKTQKLWKLYWMRANGKWVLYEPAPRHTLFEQGLDAVEKDDCGCFFG